MKYTKDNPFELGGVQVYPGGSLPNGTFYGAYVDDLVVSGGVRFLPHSTLDALKAYFKTEEPEGWHWTNADHTEARNGRWSVTPETEYENARIEHEDFDEWWFFSGTANGWVNESLEDMPGTFRRVVDEYLTWRTAQDQPEEPTGLGAVVEVDGRRWVRTNDPSIKWTSEGGTFTQHWSGLLSRGTVTVLSKGVES